MNPWRKRKRASSRDGLLTRLKHEFVIGPERQSDLFGRAARIYHCVRCKWSFLVGGGKVAILDQDRNPIVGAEGLKRFNTFAEGPCPVLEAFVSAALANAESLGVPSRSRRDAPGRVAPKMPVWSGRPRPALRVLTRMRESFGRQT